MNAVDQDRGAATIWVLAVGLTLVGAGMVGVAIGTARIARHQAAVAADLGALAGAPRAVEGAPAACARAAAFVGDNGGRMVSCRLDGLDLILTVEVDVTPLRGMHRTTTATARAGPIRAVASS